MQETLRTLADPQLAALSDPPQTPALDQLVRLTARLLRAPLALIASVDPAQPVVAALGAPALAASADLPLLAQTFGQIVVAAGAPLALSDVRADPRADSSAALSALGVVAYLAVPIHNPAGLIVGACCVIDQLPHSWSADDLMTLVELAALAGLELDRQAQQASPRSATALRLRDSAQLNELLNGRDRLQTLAAQLLHTQEAERRAVARALHDEVGQELTLIQLSLQALQDAPPTQVAAQLTESIAIVERGLAQVRALALDLRPAQLDDLGLAETLRWYLGRQASIGQLALRLTLPPLVPRPPALIETTCFRIAQEAMTNILRSARASQVWVTVELLSDGLTLMVRDDGCGFDVAAARARAVQGASLGLLSMEERAALVGGRMTIESAVGQGTCVRAWLPRTVAGAAA